MKKLALSLLAFPGILSFANAQQYTPKLARSFPNYLTDTSIGGITGNFEFNGKFYLTDDVRLWTSDGTAGGTQVVKQFFPAGLTTAPAIAALREMGGKLYMVAHDNINGYELWVTDGTGAGTQMIKDINPGPGDGILVSYNYTYDFMMVVMNNELYFYGDDGVNGIELWKSDGTAAGTQMVKDVNITSGKDILDVVTSSQTPIATLAATSNRVFFSANDGGNGPELWVTDGTAAGTQLVQDIVPNTVTIPPRGPEHFAVFDNKVVFHIDDHLASYHGLWISDGTSAGTQQISTGVTTLITDYLEFNGKLYLYGYNKNNSQQGLFIADGTGAGTQFIKALAVGGHFPGSSSQSPWQGNTGVMVAYNNKVYFPAQDAGSNGEELWVSDGTAAGTKMVKDLTPYLAHHSSSPKHLVVFGDKLYMRATDTGYASMIWQTDGTTAGTKQITYPLTNVSKISYTDWLRLRLSTLAPVGDKLYFWNLYNSTESFSLYTLNMFPDGIKHAGINGKLELSPNPVNDYLYFSKELKNISLYTMNGSLVDKKGQATRIETAQLLPGTYIIQADEDGSQKQGVFIKQ